MNPPYLDPASGIIPTKRYLKKISPLTVGATLGVIYALISLLIVPFILIAMALGASAAINQSNSGVGPLFASVGGGMFLCILAPILYGLLGFIAGSIAAIAYNIAAKFTGGIAFEIR